MSHLDDWAAALVDSELAHDDRDRALAHLAGCAACRSAVDVQRRSKAALGSATEPPAPSPDLTARLLAIPGGTTTPVRRDVVRRPAAASRPRGARPWPGRASRPVSARRGTARRRTLSGISVLGAALTLAVIAGGEAPGRVAPPIGSYVIEHTATTTQLPLHDPVAGVVLISTR